MLDEKLACELGTMWGAKLGSLWALEMGKELGQWLEQKLDRESMEVGLAS